MKCLIILSAAVALAAANPHHLYGVHPTYHWAAPAVSSSQYHAQDELGQYSYGYAEGNSAKHEVKTWDGVTRGGYSYVDANGIVQTVNYIADAVHGFRVAATNLPLGPGAAPAAVVDTPEVVAARSAHLAAHAAAKVAVPIHVVAAPLPVVDTPEVAAARAAHLAAHAAAKVSTPIAVAAPVNYAPVVAAPVNYYAPAFAANQWAVPVASSQYHAQDELGQYSYGYNAGPSTKHETKTWDGVTRGGYSYVDANGIVQTVNYISDSINGFRVAATNLPLGPGIAPAPVVDTPEVVAARSAHFAAHAEARALHV